MASGQLPLSAMTLHKPKPIAQEDECASTDVGSNTSDAESCSSSSSSSGSGLWVRRRPETLADLAGPLGQQLGLRRRSVALRGSLGRGLDLSRRRLFRGTPLEPIPGTPVAANGTWGGTNAGSQWAEDEDKDEGREATEEAEADAAVPILPLPPPRSPTKLRRQRFAAASGATPETCPASSPPGVWTTIASSVSADATAAAVCANAVQVSEDTSPEEANTSSTAPAAPCFLYGPVRMAPPSPRRRLREATLAKARQEGTPLKVRPPTGYAFSAALLVQGGVLDAGIAALPVKKRPIFEEAAGEGAAKALRDLEPGLPVKMVVHTRFLVGEPLRTPVFPPPPGLVPPAR